MGWKTAGLIRVSGLTDGTDVDVLEAIASFLNEEDGRCFPALESVMLVARKSRNIVRQSIKALCEQGLLSFSAEPERFVATSFMCTTFLSRNWSASKSSSEQNLAKRVPRFRS